MKNILSLFVENEVFNASKERSTSSSFNDIKPFYVRNFLKEKENERMVFTEVSENNYCPLDLDDSSLISFSKNILDRKNFTALSFEDELKLFQINLDCYEPIDDTIRKISFLIKALVHFYLREYCLSKYFYDKLKQDDLNGTTWDTSYTSLGILLNHHVSNLVPAAVENISILLSRKNDSLFEAVAHLNIKRKLRNEFGNISFSQSTERSYEDFLEYSKNSKLVFLLSHGDNENGLIYYNCKKSDEIYFDFDDIVDNYKDAELIFLLGCTRTPYEGLIENFKFVGLPIEPESSFEFGEMFIKAFIYTYQYNNDIEMSLLSGQLCGNLFLSKNYEFSLFHNKDEIHDI